MANKQITVKDVNAKVDKLADSVARLANSFESLVEVLQPKGKPCESIGTAEELKPAFPILKDITEIGTVVDLGTFKVRLCDLNYNGTGKKLWHCTEALMPDNVGLGLPNNDNSGGYPTAENIEKVLNEIFETLPAEIRNQIVDMEIPCYIPEKKEIENHSNPIFLLSATEMCQNRSYLAKEGRPLEYYIKNTPEFNDWHWLRTPYLDNSGRWGGVYRDGVVNYYDTTTTMAWLPHFALIKCHTCERK